MLELLAPVRIAGGQFFIFSEHYFYSLVLGSTVVPVLVRRVCSASWRVFKIGAFSGESAVLLALSSVLLGILGDVVAPSIENGLIDELLAS